MLVKTDGLTKRYGEFPALDNCSLEVRSGEIFGLLGPNGAGKTTLLRLLMGFLRPSAGHASIDGLDCYQQSVRVHARVAYLPGEARLFRQMRGRDVLRFLTSIRADGDLQRACIIAERLDLDVTRRVAQMSTGMRQKLALAGTLANSAPLLILDEPTNSLDPTVRSTVLRLVQEARDEGRTIMFSSHILPEVEELCDRVVILRSGHVVHTQIMSELRQRHRILARLSGPLPQLPASFNGQVTIQRLSDHSVVIETPGELSSMLGWLATLPLEEVNIEPVGLRSIYSQYHGEGIQHAGGEPDKVNIRELERKP